MSDVKLRSPSDFRPDLRNLSWLFPVGLGLAALYFPTYWLLSKTVWASDEQGHGPIILAICCWLIWRKWEALVALPDSPATVTGICLFLFSLLVYFVGRTQQLETFEVLSQIFLIASLLLLFKGWAAVRELSFVLFFMLFMVPLPTLLVQIITVPLKTAVSYVAENALHLADYPVSRTGVIISVGPYQLLVADACAGLNSMFTLEALGLLYLNIMSYTSVARKVVLAILIVPISFIANIVRVIVLVLVTYHFGDEAGQGFVHAFAGMLLFMVALVLILAVDSVLGVVLQRVTHSKQGSARIPV